MNNDDFLNYLQNTWQDEGTVEKLSNGSYHFQHSSNRYSVFIPPSCTSGDVQMWNYIPGAGGIYEEGGIVLNSVYSDNPPNCIVTTSLTASDEENAALSTANLLTKAGLNVDKACITSFSLGFKDSVINANALQAAYPDMELSVLVNDGYRPRDILTDPSLTAALSENETPVYLLLPPGELMSSDRRADAAEFTEGLYNNNLNLYVLTTDHSTSQSHAQRNQDMVVTNLPEYILGANDLNRNDNFNLCNYQLYRYLGNGSAELLSLEDIQDGGYVHVGNPELFTMKMSASDIRDLSNGSGSVVASNTAVIVEGINSIAEEVKKSEACVNASKVSVKSTTGIPAGLSAAQESYIEISRDLLSRLNVELNVIQSMGQTYYDMNKDLARKASELSGGGSTPEVEIEARLSGLINQEIEASRTFSGQYLLQIKEISLGNTGKVNIEDINAMLNGGSLSGPLKENFETERANAGATKSRIDEFIGNIGNSSLQGEAWDKVKSRLGEYSEIMQKRIESADALEEAMVEALKLIKDYMGEYEELDDSKLPELEDTLEKIKQELENAEKVSTQTKVVQEWVVDNAGNQYYKEYSVYVYDSESRKRAREYIEWAKEKIIEIEKEIVKIKGLPEIMKQAMDIVNNALLGVYKDYGVQTNNIVTGKASTYIAPSYTPHVAKPIEEYVPKEEEKDDREKWYRSEAWYGRGKEKTYGSYEDYLNGVKAEDNPDYSEIEDKGIKAPYEFNMEEEIEESKDEEIPNEEVEVQKPEEEQVEEIPTQGPVGSTAPPSGTQGPVGSTTPPFTSQGQPGNTPGTQQPPVDNNPPIESETPDVEQPPQDEEPQPPSEGEKPGVENKPVEDEKPTVEVKPNEENIGNNVDTKPNINTKPNTSGNVNTKPNVNTNNNTSKPVTKPSQTIPDSYIADNTIGTEQNPGEVIDKPIDDVIVDEPIIEDVPLEEMPPVEEVPPIQEIPSEEEIIELPKEEVKEKESKNALGTIGTIVGVGTAIGGVGYGAYKYVKSKEDDTTDDDDEDY